ncbi:Mitogen-activated protein kinase kinase kinase protein [Dioscorea alata]|uniref:Mitogen-activated protein kinase kinase kinase protein n=1 Tax=Dioscorea alata TaxID=55571 RepID=A0ACB7VBL9_DIOAL|nr:Mitogen-activated protein kinase kinase kinase protein [Dioscorea alata]
MPAWWRAKSKPKGSKVTISDDHHPRRSVSDHIPTTRALDSPVTPKSAPASGGGAAAADLFDFAHPQPLPLPSLSVPLLVASVPGSVSASSGSSSVSSDENPELAFFRPLEPGNIPRDRNMKFDSQRLQNVIEESRTFTYTPVLEPVGGSDTSSSRSTLPHGRTSNETIYHRRSANGATGPREHPFHAPPTSPIHQRAFTVSPESVKLRQDDLKSPPHPLPLPPGSPSSPPISSASRSLQSHWKKGKLLGRGTFGHVYQGFNSESGQMCAIKEVKIISDDANSAECLRQLNQEIALLSQLSHPNIVQYYGSELVDGSLSVYLEYVSGGSIHKLLQEYGPFGEPVIRSYAGQILSGLAYLHGRNTVHRDIKGANILVGPNGEIKLADFGMAKHISAFTSIRSFKGSPYWMAPEVIMNGSGYNLSVDIWSLGCTILEMATSKPPWSQYEGVAAIFKIGNSKDIPEIPEHLSPDAKNFLKLCFQRNPSARPTAAELLGHPFVRDQATAKAGKFSFAGDALKSPDRSHALATMDFSSKRSLSPLRDGDYGIRHTVGFPSSSHTSDLAGLRMNMSLPVSPCSSPLRQYRQSNRSCLPSPPHPSYSTGTINHGPSNHSLYPTRLNFNFSDPWPDFHQLKLPTPFDSPLKSVTPYDSPMRSTPYGSPRKCL